MYCIQEADKPNNILKIFNIVQLTGNKIILPITGDEVLSYKKAQKLVKKTKKVLEQTISKRIVISKKIQKQEKYMEMLKQNDYEIADGRWLFEVLSCEILDYITKQKAIKKEETTISILVNNLTENIIEIIRKISQQYKRVNIVTNHIQKLKKIEQQILEKDGIMITVGNNKKKGLAKSNIILNFDFSSKVIQQYNIYENAIIINVKEEVEIMKKRFNGITINDYDITFENLDNYEYDETKKYKCCEIYEAQLNKKQPFNDIMKIIKSDKVRITKLVGKNTVFYPLEKTSSKRMS